MRRQCGDCQLCCRLLPVHDNERPWQKEELHKKAGERCKYQKFGVGCSVYNTSTMPFCCTAWNCRWIVGTIPDYMSRPDRCHYVIDVMPDYVTLEYNDGTPQTNLEAVQIWIDPKHPDAHRDPALREWLLELGERGIIGLVRYNEQDCMSIFPPNLSDDKQWHEVTRTTASQKQHSLKDVVRALNKGSTK